MLTVLECDASPDSESDLPLVPLTNTITTVTSSHFSPGSEKSRLPKSWRARAICRQRWNGESLSPDAAPWWAKAQFSPLFNLGGRERGVWEEKNRQEGKHTRRCDARLQRSREFIFSVFHHARLMFVQLQKKKNLSSWQRDFFLLKSECLVVTSLNMLDLRLELNAKQLTAAPVVAGGIDAFSTHLLIRKTPLPDVYLLPSNIVEACNLATEASNGPPLFFNSLYDLEFDGESTSLSSMWKALLLKYRKKKLSSKDNLSPSSASLPPPLARLYLLQWISFIFCHYLETASERNTLMYLFNFFQFQSQCAFAML